MAVEIIKAELGSSEVEVFTRREFEVFKVSSQNKSIVVTYTEYKYVVDVDGNESIISKEQKDYIGDFTHMFDSSVGVAIRAMIEARLVLPDPQNVPE